MKKKTIALVLALAALTGAVGASAPVVGAQAYVAPCCKA